MPPRPQRAGIHTMDQSAGAHTTTLIIPDIAPEFREAPVGRRAII